MISLVFSFARRAIAFELTMWRSLIRWILRRPVTREPGAKPFSYAGVVTPAIIGFIAVSAIEIPILHLLLPWKTVKLVCLALGAQGLMWMVAYLASLRIHPHTVGDSGLRVRHTTSVDFTIPWSAIASIGTRIRSVPKNRAVQFDSADPEILHIAVGSQTNVDVLLREPVTIPLPRGARETVKELRLYADDSHGLVGVAKSHI